MVSVIKVSKYGKSEYSRSDSFYSDDTQHHSNSAPINVKPAGGGGGRAWGGDLIVIVGPGLGYLTDLVFPGEGIFESLFARRGDI